MTSFGNLPEHQATGRIAEIYDEIRVYGAVPYVSSLQRQLATIPGCLEWLWDGVRPAFVGGRVPLAAWGAVEGLDYPSLAHLCRAQRFACSGSTRRLKPAFTASTRRFCGPVR